MIWSRGDGGGTYWQGAHWHLVRHREYPAGRRESQTALRSRKNDHKSVQSKPKLVNRKGVLSAISIERRGGAVEGKFEGTFFSAPVCRVASSANASRGPCLIPSEEEHSSTYLLQLQLGTTSAIGIGRQAGSQKTPDGVGIHGGQRVVVEGPETRGGERRVRERARERVGDGSSQLSQTASGSSIQNTKKSLKKGAAGHLSVHQRRGQAKKRP